MNNQKNQALGNQNCKTKSAPPPTKKKTYTIIAMLAVLGIAILLFVVLRPSDGNNQNAPDELYSSNYDNPVDDGGDYYDDDYSTDTNAQPNNGGINGRGANEQPNNGGIGGNNKMRQDADGRIWSSTDGGRTWTEILPDGSPADDGKSGIIDWDNFEGPKN